MGIVLTIAFVVFVFGLYADWSSEPQVDAPSNQGPSIQYFSVKKGA